MQSLREIYKTGKGPSSSHTMGPERAIKIIRGLYPEADALKVTLYGSLALTGKGHNTDTVIIQTASPLPCEVVWNETAPCDVHPNTMDIEVLKGGGKIAEKRVYSVGGGTVYFDGEPAERYEKYADDGIYPLNSYTEISKYCKSHNLRIWQYVEKYEGKEIFDYLGGVWETMKRSIHQGLTTSGTLPGILGTKRRAQKLYNQRHIDESAQTRENRLVCSYAFAVGEQNAAGGVIVTAPTCGACGVVPSVLNYMQETRGFSDEEIVRALATGGIIGNLIKKNASISGAECGCQAEIGAASAMAAGSVAYLLGGGGEAIAHAAALAMKNLLGLACDPVAGLVEVPCVKRNVIGAVNALTSADMAASGIRSRIPPDEVFDAMRNVGRMLPEDLRETGKGGLAATPTGIAFRENLKSF